MIDQKKVVVRCSRCVMDNESDETIRFDENGVCNYCKEAEQALALNYFPNEVGQKMFSDLCEKIKKESRNKKYDCLIGVSGGLDSSYLMMKCFEKGLRILALHIDDGYDTELAKENIKKLCQKCNAELITVVPDPIQFNALTLAYMKAGVCNLAAPQDNVLFASIYNFAIKNKIKYFMSGSNLSLESILERSETYSCFDTKNMKDINRKNGNAKIDKLPLLSYFRLKVILKIYGIKTVRPLNMLDYRRDAAINELNSFCGYTYYKAKHLENHLTKFVQLYWFPKKFGVDKRKSHLSSMIISKQMTREEAISELQKPIYDEKDMNETIEILIKSLGITRSEFESIINSKPHSHYEYKTSFIYNLFKKR